VNNNERISQLEVMMSDLLKRFDITVEKLDNITEQLRQTTEQTRQTNEQLRQTNEQLRQSDERQQVMLRALVQQTDTNTAMMRKLENHENRLGGLESGSVSE
jgi:FtsZ-binding cell division protein ZapB